MQSFTCEDANKIYWSNDLIDEAIAMRLLLNTYEQRPETSQFWKKKQEFETVYLSQCGNNDELESKIRSAFDVSNMGTSRETTSQLYSTMQLMMIIPGLLIAGTCLTRNFAAIIRNATNSNMRDAIFGRQEYIYRYKNIYLKKALGGTWKPHFGKYLFSPILIKKVFNITKVLVSYPFTPLLDYQRKLTDLCYNSGLKCWWAPEIIITLYRSKSSYSIPEDRIRNLTPDGLLGPMFPRSMRDTLHTSDRSRPWSDEFFKEWELFNKSKRETSLEFGSNHRESIEEIRKTWGYWPNREWKQRDFDMLFDRIYLKLSLKEIAAKYPWEDSLGKTSLHKSTVQRITSGLSQILGIPLPRAAYRKRSQN